MCIRDRVKAEQTLNGFLRCPSRELDNGMVRRFSGFGLNEKPCPPDALETAKANIEQYYSVVGVQERYDETVRMARIAFGVNLTEFHINRGVDKKKKGKKLDIKQRKQIKEMNRLDTELYDWVLQRFEQQLEEPSPPIQVTAGNRTDFENVKLWRAIGSSPARQEAMRASPVEGRS